MNESPVFIAHRGEASRFPENTVVALQAAVDGGVSCLEFDVQLSADQVPVLSHDASLIRTAGTDRMVSAALASELTTISVGEASRFGATFAGQTLPDLDRVLRALADTARTLTLFVELKRHSLQAFGRQRVLRAVLPRLAKTHHRVVLISFDYDVLMAARKEIDVGWVLSHYDDATLAQARALAPQFLFCNQTRLPPRGELRAGDWQWAIYEITSQDEVKSLLARGASHFESMWSVALRRTWYGNV